MHFGRLAASMASAVPVPVPVPDLIKRSCDVLGLPAPVACAALAFHHALRAATLADELALELRADVQRTATACIFLAAKVLEASLRTNDLSNVVLYLLRSPGTQREVAATAVAEEAMVADAHAQEQQQGQNDEQQAAADADAERAQQQGREGHGGQRQPTEEPPPVPQQRQQQQMQEPAHHGGDREERQQNGGGWRQPPPPPPPQQALSRADMLVGDRYYEHKRLLIQDEQVLLRMLRFNVCVQQPHPYLLCLCRALAAPPAQARLAICCLNDALSSGLGAGGSYRPAEQAAAALHTAEAILWPEREPDEERWAALGLRTVDVLTLSRLWIAVLKSRLTLT